ncbi:hypothetical protein [Vallitalea guaymasensis]|uniref:hypothetical protein n=1 Tax=Vallitalea guaymasensis TaxID=1185412 RepID=UPI00187D1507|nr:hypothetical protein [Vallitalea guaymasensis]
MINEVVVRIIAERITNGGINPKTREVFKIDDIKHSGYNTAIKNYIIEHGQAIR